MKKRPHLVGTAKKRFLGRDHHDVGIRREQLDDAVGIPRREPGSEAFEEPGKFRRTALRCHARYCGELPDVGFEEAHALLACLAGLRGRQAKAAAAALAEFAGPRGLEWASEVLARWAS